MSLIDFRWQRGNCIKCIREVIKSLESHLGVLKAENLIQWRKSLHFTVEGTDITGAAGLMIFFLTSLPGNSTTKTFTLVHSLIHNKASFSCLTKLAYIISSELNFHDLWYKRTNAFVLDAHKSE